MLNASVRYYEHVVYIFDTAESYLCHVEHTLCYFSMLHMILVSVWDQAWNYICIPTKKMPAVNKIGQLRII